MRYKLLGRSGLRVSELALGTMTFGPDWGWGADADESRRIFERYDEAGGNFVDTANNYTDGTSESLVGGLTEPDRERWVIATKYSLSLDPNDPNAGGNHRKSLVRSLEQSLRRLRTDYVDLLWLHMRDATTPIEEAVRALDDQVRLGKVLYVGISDSPAWVAAQANTIADLRGWSPFVALQIPYSVASRAPERELLPMAASLGLALVPWGVLGAGILTGKPASERRWPEDRVSEKTEQVVERPAQHRGRPRRHARAGGDRVAAREPAARPRSSRSSAPGPRRRSSRTSARSSSSSTPRSGPSWTRRARRSSASRAPSSSPTTSAA